MKLIKKVDKVVLKSFLGPFFLTMLVVIFILLTQHMLKYFDDLVGKDLGWDVLGQLIFYFAIFVTPFSFPLAVLLSSLMTFGNLGEHSELTAIKSGGISLPRTMRSIFIFVLLVTGFAFVSNNYFFPKASLEAYSLLWDIKRKKPSLDLPEGEFYGGLENYRIRVEKKYDDGSSLKNVIIYDHSDRSGNNEVTIADSGRITTIMNDRYLRFELFDGHSFIEGYANRDNVSRNRGELNESFSKVRFDKSEMIFDLNSFDLERTEKELFSRNRLMRNMGQIQVDVDSMRNRIDGRRMELWRMKYTMFSYDLVNDSLDLPPDLQYFQEIQDSIDRAREFQALKKNVHDTTISDSILKARADTMFRAKRAQKRAGPTDNIPTDIRQSFNRPPVTDTTDRERPSLIQSQLDSTTSEDLVELVQSMDTATSYQEELLDDVIMRVRQVKNRIFNDADYVIRNEQEIRIFQIQYHKILANSIACLVMFFIGAPLGSIIKKGGLGVPVLVSIFFFIVYYVFMILGEKWTKSGLMEAWQGIWLANMILFPIGLFFLLQARRDARLFDSDFYLVIASRMKKIFRIKDKPREAPDATNK